MKALLASLLAALFALAALSSFAAAPAGSGLSAVPPTSLAADEDDKDKDKEGGKKSD